MVGHAAQVRDRLCGGEGNEESSTQGRVMWSPLPRLSPTPSQGYSGWGSRTVRRLLAEGLSACLSEAPSYRALSIVCPGVLNLRQTPTESCWEGEVWGSLILTDLRYATMRVPQPD